MAIQHGFAFPRNQQDNAPSSGDGQDGAVVPATGQRNPDYTAPVDPGQDVNSRGLVDTPERITRA